MADFSISDMGGYESIDMPPDDILQQRLSAQQQGPDPAAVYAAHQAKAADLAQQKEQADLKQGDLDLGGRLIKMLDPNVPKPARQFLYKEMSRQMGVDPKGETSKEVGQLLTGLDPEAMDNLRRTFAQRIPGAKPGEINELIKGVLTGKVGGMQLVGLAGQQQPDGGGEEPAAGGGPPKPGSEPQRRRIPGPGETPTRYQTTDPGLVKIMGLNPRTPYRNDDLIQQGYTLPIDPKQQRELVEKIQDQTAATLNTSVEASRMYQLFQGKPEVLGLVGGVARTADQIIDQGRGLLRTAGKAIGVEIADEVDISDKKTQGLARRAAEAISRKYKESGFEQTAVDSARLNSATINMAYSMAIARGIPGNRMTNAIINQHLGELGNSQSVAQFEAALSDTMQRVFERTRTEVSSKLGKDVKGIDLSKLSNEQIDVMHGSSKILPPDLRAAVMDDIKRRVAGGDAPAGTDVPRTSPTVEDEQRLEADDQARKESREKLAESRAAQELQLKELREQRQGRSETRAEDRADRAEFENNRRHELALRREARMEQAQRRDKITAAFLHLGQAIAASGKASVGGVGGGSGGGDQDAGAFRISSSGRRGAPPSPVDASRFQRQK